MKTYELLNEEKKLCRRNYSCAKDDPNFFVSPLPYPDAGVCKDILGTVGVCKAVKWDIIGALMYCYPDYNEYYKHYDTIIQSSRIHEWVEAYKNTLPEPELMKLRKNYGVDWVVFNDCAKFDEIWALLKELDI